MRRGEMFLAAAFALGVILFLLPVRSRPVSPSGASGAAAGDSVRSRPAPIPAPAHIDRRTSLDDYDFDRDAAARFKLPKSLTEISGLATTADGRILAHGDEKGVVYELDLTNGEVRKSFAVMDARGIVVADFEGIAVAGDRIYLVTSDGMLYEFREGGDGEQVPCTIHNTGYGRDYEFEGVTFEPRTQELLLLAKAPLSKGEKDRLPIVHWSIATGRIVEDSETEIPVKDIEREASVKDVWPSDIACHPVTGNYFVVAAHQNVLAEITPDGELVGVRRLSKKWHEQAEGLTLTVDLGIVIGDEGGGQEGRLTVYPPGPK